MHVAVDEVVVVVVVVEVVVVVLAVNSKGLLMLVTREEGHEKKACMGWHHLSPQRCPAQSRAYAGVFQSVLFPN